MEDPHAPHGAEPVPTEKKLEDLYALVDGISTAMFTTRRLDGRLVSRPMATQERDAIADFWFVTDDDSDKLDELEHDPHVNLSYYRDRTREWVSVSGTARISRDREQIRRLYKPDWRAWFADQGGERDGGPGDPRLTLVLVEADSVIYMKSDTPRPVVLFEVVKGIITGQQPDVGSVRAVSASELHGSR
ncbi:MAG TPA: pyridoxamine 5'-phosphate oxidase family protein [Longimicrobium sp.]|nr:pyridoxamine 5'-phosphate oxidase family protein [Longimicrobium sp.]